jgi:excisionase family DNA binding protein
MSKIAIAENLRNVKETAQLLRVSPFALREWVRQQKIAVYKIGGRFFFSESDIAAFLANSRTEAVRRRPVKASNSEASA